MYQNIVQYGFDRDLYIAIRSKSNKIKMRMISMLGNVDVVGFWTFTFYDDIPNEERQKLWNKFMARLRWKMKGTKIRYFKVKEYTKRGKIHYHVVFNVFLSWELVQGMWESIGAGKVVDVKKINNPVSASRYIAKYLVKSLIDSVGDARGLFSCSFDFCLHLSCFPKWLNKALDIDAMKYLKAVTSKFDFPYYLYGMNLSRLKYVLTMQFLSKWLELTGDCLWINERCISA